MQKSLAATFRTTLFRSPTIASVPFLGYLPFANLRKQMRSFLGQALFFQPFVRYYAILAAPLNAAISGSTDFRSTPALVDAFDKLKDGIANAATLAPLDYCLPIIVRPDASMEGVGGGR